MALHRDIYWVGRQWAVTGHGIQAVDQRLKGKFDIEASRVWEDGLLEGMRSEAWVNAEDLDRALAIARKHHPEPPRSAAPLDESVLDLIETVLKETGSDQAGPKPADSKEAGSGETAEPPCLNAASVTEPAVEPPKPAAHLFDMHVESWPAKFVPQWRIRMRR